MASFPEMHLVDFLVQSYRIGLWLFAPFFLLLCIFTYFFPPIMKVLELFQYEKKKPIKAILIRGKKL